MSARQPFVPTRAPSRVGFSGQDPKPSDNRFDFTNATNDSATVEVNSVQSADAISSGNDASKTSSGVASDIILNSTHKPLNLAGFAKRKNRPEQQVFSAIAAQNRRSFDGSVRPRSPAIAQHARPFSPFFPRGQDIVSLHPRASRRSSPSRMQTDRPSDELSSNQAHIVPSRALPDNTSVGGNDSRQHPNISSGIANNSRISARPSLEKIHEAHEEEDLADRGPYELAGSREQGPIQAEATTRLSIGVDDPSRRPAKRSQHPEPEIEDAYDYAPALKRYKQSNTARSTDVSCGLCIRETQFYHSIIS